MRCYSDDWWLLPSDPFGSYWSTWWTQCVDAWLTEISFLLQFNAALTHQNIVLWLKMHYNISRARIIFTATENTLGCLDTFKHADKKHPPPEQQTNVRRKHLWKKSHQHKRILLSNTCAQQPTKWLHGDGELPADLTSHHGDASSLILYSIRYNQNDP